MAGVPVHHENTDAPQFNQLFGGVEAAKVAVTRHGGHGDVGIVLREVACIAAAVAEVQNMMGLELLHGAAHIVHIAVGVGQD